MPGSRPTRLRNTRSPSLELDILSSDSGGASGVRTRLRNQMKRLFSATVQLVYEDQHGEVRVTSFIADRTEFWWNERKPDESLVIICPCLEQTHFRRRGKEMLGKLTSSVSSCDILEEDRPSSTDQL